MVLLNGLLLCCLRLLSRGCRLVSYCISLLIDLIRKDKRSSFSEELNLKEQGHENNYSDLKEILNEAVNQLPELQRMVLLLRDYEGYSYKEIGEMANLNESQVKVYIYRARVFLKKYIGKIDVLV